MFARAGTFRYPQVYCNCGVIFTSQRERKADFDLAPSIWFVFYWNLLYAIALVLTVITECVGKPDSVIREDKCVNQYAVVVGASVINVVSDLMILIIPIAAIWGLHMSREKKIKLSAVFAVGLL